MAGCEDDARAAQPPHGSCRRESSANRVLSTMGSVVTVALCSTKPSSCQNAPRRPRFISRKSNHRAVREAEKSASSQSVIGEKVGDGGCNGRLATVGGFRCRERRDYCPQSKCDW